jgi:hypothetical protein
MPNDGRVAASFAFHLLTSDPNSKYLSVLRWAKFLAPINGQLREASFYSMMHRPSRTSDLVREMRRGLVVNPSPYNLNYMGSLLHRRIERLQTAIRLMERAVVVNSDSRTAHEHLWKLKVNWGWKSRGAVGNFHVANGDKANDKRFYRTEKVLFFPNRMGDFDDIDTVLRRDIFFNYLPTEPVIAADAPSSPWAHASPSTSGNRC